MKTAVIAALVCLVLSTAGAGELPANKWAAMNEPASGVQVLGWDEARYAPDLDGVLILGAYRSYTSENQNAFWLYRFRENRWRLLHVNLFWHRGEMASDGGHTAGRMTWDRRRQALVYGGPVSMSPNDRHRTWVFDPRAQVGWDAHPPAPVPATPFDAASVYVPELGGSLRYHPSAGTWLYDAVKNRWTQLVKPGAGPTLDCAEAVYDPKRARVLVFGGSSGHYSGRDFSVSNDLWQFDVAKKAWTKLAAKNPPPGRGWPQMALSPDADVVLMAGGALGKRSPKAGILRHSDTWVLDLASLQWRELKDAGFPGAGWSNHTVYDPLNRVFLHVGPRKQNYGYSCGMYALRLSDGPQASARGGATAGLARPWHALSDNTTLTPALSLAGRGGRTPTYDTASLPKASGTWSALETGALAKVKGWCMWPSLVSSGKELLLAFGEYPEWPGPRPDPIFSVRAFRYGDGAWAELEGGDLRRRHPYWSQTPAIAFGPKGEPLLAYEGYRIWQKMGIRTRRFADGAWRSVGAAADDVLAAGFVPALAGGAKPVLAYQHYTQGGRGAAVAVMELAGDAWEAVPVKPPAADPKTAPNRLRFPVVARDGKDRLILAWQEHRTTTHGGTSGPERVRVMRREGDAWASLGGTVPVAAPEARVVSFAMTLHDGEPVTASCEGADGGRCAVVVRRWSGTAWERLGSAPLNVLGPEGGALRPALVPDGKSLYAAWPEFLPGCPPLLFVKQWDGASWRLIGGPLNAAPGAGSAHRPALAILDGKPVVAWTEFALEGVGMRRVHVKRLN